MNDVDLQEVFSQEHLDVYFFEDGSLHGHIEYIV